MGDLLYKLVFTGLRDNVYKKQLSKLRQMIGVDCDPQPVLEPTLLVSHYDLGDYTVHATFAKGVTYTVAVGVNRSDGCVRGTLPMSMHIVDVKEG